MNKLLLIVALITSVSSLHSMELESQLCDTVEHVKQLNERALVSSLIQTSSITLLQAYHKLSKYSCPDIARSILLNFSLMKLSVPITLPQIYHYFSQLLHSGIAYRIFAFQLGDSNLANFSYTINEDHVSPGKLISCIRKLIASCGYSLSDELFKQCFDYKKKSICDIKSFNDDTVLHLSLFDKYDASYTECAQLFLNVAGDDRWKLLRAQDHYGNVALHYAVPKGIEAVKLVLDAAGNNTKTLLFMGNNDDHTGLHRAARAGNTEIVKFLLDAAGDDVQNFMAIKTKDEQTAFDIANSEVREVLQQYMQKDNQS